MPDTIVAPAPTAPAAPAAAPILTPAPAIPAAGQPQPQGGAPNAQPEAPKNADGSPQDPSKTPDAPKAPAGAPEKYADFKLPDGVALDAKLSDEFKSVAKALNLPQEAAQQLVDLQAKAVARSAEDQIAEFNKMTAEWRKEALTALGSEPEKELQFAAKARDQFASPELMKVLSETGLANHPEMVKMFVKLGKAVAEDRLLDGKSALNSKSDPAAKLYGGTPVK